MKNQEDKNCPYCGHFLNTGIDISEDSPTEKNYDNSIGLCYYCANIVVFMDGEPGKMTEELIELLKEVNPTLYDNILVAQKELLHK